MVRQEDDEHGPLCFRVLGPLQVQGEEPVTVTARRQSVVLSLLLLSPNQVVALKSMIDAVWGETPPTTARAQVQTAVSVLRRSLARAGLGERIRMQGTGYLIDLAPGELDLHVFADLVARGQAAGVAGIRRRRGRRSAPRWPCGAVSRSATWTATWSGRSWSGSPNGGSRCSRSASRPNSNWACTTR